MKTVCLVRPAHSCCPPREPVVLHVVRPEDTEILTGPPCEPVKATFGPSVVRPLNTLKALPGARAVCLGEENKLLELGGPKRPHETERKPSGFPAERLSHKALLRELVDRCIAGDCDHGTAAKLLTMRRAVFDEYVRLARAERLALRRLQGAFYVAFPECDPRHAVTARSWPERKADDLFREPVAAPCVTYSAAEAEHLPTAQPHLLMPDVEMDLISYNTNEQLEAGELDFSGPDSLSDPWRGSLPD